MEITIEPVRITKELILSRFPQEQILEYYLGIPVKKGLFKNPLRDDKRPTASFFKTKIGIVIFHDFSGCFSGDCFKVVMEKFQCNFSQALHIIANDFGIIHDDKLVVNQPKLKYTGNKLDEKQTSVIRVEIRPFQTYELNWWAKYGIQESTLKKFGVFSCKNIWLNGNIFHYESPKQKIFGYYGGIKDGIEQWRLYWPERTTMRFLTNWKSSQIQGARQLPKDGGDLLIIQKSMKDVMCMYELGIIAIAPNSENLFLNDIQLEKVKNKFKRIIVWYDNDDPGKNALARIKEKHPELEYFYIPEKYEAKDFSDFYKKYGKEKAIELLKTELNINKWEEKEAEPTIEQEDIEPSKK